ncbi:MAG: hypothetical protein ACI4WH_07845 [Oscillospiraceae bacterium]
MEINNVGLYKFLKFNGIEYLHHVSNVITVNELIKCGGFISRKQAKEKNIYYPLKYDENFYKEFDIYEDIFFNPFDLHKFYRRPNYFGCVDLSVSIEILLDKNAYQVAITRNNPLYWNKSIKNRYYSTMEEYTNDFYNAMANVETCNQMYYQQIYYTFRHCKDIIPFQPYLHEITVDNPHFKINRQNVFKPSMKLLRKTIREYNPKIKLLERNCLDKCMCKFFYQDMEEEEILRIFYT